MKPRVAILDIGSGNLRSAEKAVARVGAETTITSDPKVAVNADGLVVPGVGAFGSCWQGLQRVRGDRVIGQRLAGSRPVFGICIGMQLMFEQGEEFPYSADAEAETTKPTATAGLGEWPGTVRRLDASVLPHMGWNTVDMAADSQLFDGIAADTRFYFVHSYAALEWSLKEDPDGFIAPPKVSWAKHEDCRFVAAVENGPLWATQFHPEKSGDAGAVLLENWLHSF
ncbi:MAG TPA: imidazole glycerol phosphate synthase subunit HisH [Corynebacteriales bacterium]|nr:imidazole glycerol phosphate synthase subunit HisH [Mycobacteriales bacterium]